MSKNYNNEIYKMYEEELKKNDKLLKENKNLKLENANLKYELKYLQESCQNKMTKAVKQTEKPLLEENIQLKKELEKTQQEILRLKSVVLEKDSMIENLTTDNKLQEYEIDKLACSNHKNSTNSGIPTSKEIGTKKVKTGANVYNHREQSKKNSGGQIGHKGTTLSKEKIEQKIKDNNLKVIEVKHYINGICLEKDIVKFKIGIRCETYVEKHIFVHTPKSEERLPMEFYTDVTYKDDVKSLITILGNYYSIGYQKITEFLFDISNGIIEISEGSIDNIYEEFSKKTEPTINNIITNILNGKYQHTDETTTKENGKETYYRGYANAQNVVYKYHHHKGDKPILEDGILDNYFGTIISDHDVTIFKYGLNNQDCVVHIGRYCKEESQNIYITSWQMEIYYLLLRIERNRKILSKFGRTYFTIAEKEYIKKEYKNILKRGQKENEEISSTYWKDKANALLRRLIKYENSVLFYIHDFDIPYDNNFMERALRTIKGKTKNSGGFRSENGGKRFGNIMSVIKTAKLRNMNPFDCIRAIYEGKSLFA